MIYDRHPELQRKWNKAFWARGYYAATIGNLTEEAIKIYIRNKQKSHEEKIETEPHSKRQPVKELAIPAFQASSNKGSLEGFRPPSS